MHHLQTGLSCLHVATLQLHVDIIKFLCETANKGLIALTDNSGMSALDFAKRRGNADLVNYLESFIVGS